MCSIAWGDDEYTSLHYVVEQENLKVVKKLVDEHSIPVYIRTGAYKKRYYTWLL